MSSKKQIECVGCNKPYFRGELNAAELCEDCESKRAFYYLCGCSSDSESMCYECDNCISCCDCLKTLKVKFLADDSDDELGLSKLVGKAIVEVRGYVSEMGGASFKITNIVFEDGSEVGVEGEHDFPYVTTYDKWKQPNLDEDFLEGLMDE